VSEIRVIHEPDEMRSVSQAWRRAGERIGLVPTMGYLHEGHVSLMRLSAARCPHTVVSIFVNPTQFGPAEDLSRYPRDLPGDLRASASAGVEVAFVPSAEAMYPAGFQTFVEVGDLARPLCGASRPGHFRGVATVVAKLLNQVQPDVACFGAKDFQQLQVVRRMVRDLDLPVEIVAGPTVREPDGLAMSSRNAYLSPAERIAATVLVRALRAAWQAFDQGERGAADLAREARAVLDAEPLARVDYVEVLDAESLAEVTTLERPAVLALAVRLGRTRLIDNTVLGGEVRP
jgi:pantoate--beta-alanine ligase